MDHLIDDWGHTMLREGKYTPGQIDAAWTKEMIEQFNAWLEKKDPSSACRCGEPFDRSWWAMRFVSPKILLVRLPMRVIVSYAACSRRIRESC